MEKVKRSENGIITDPVTLPPAASTAQARRLMEDHNISGIPIVDRGGKLVGILTRRDMKFLHGEERIENVMTKTNLVTAPPETSLDEAAEILNRAKVEKLLLVDKHGQAGRPDHDARHRQDAPVPPRAARTPAGGCAWGRPSACTTRSGSTPCISHGVDVIVVDTAHGHSDNVIQTVEADQGPPHAST